MNKYAAKLTASNEKEYLRERARLERLQARLRETIVALTFTKAGARRKRVNSEALAEARSNKWHVDKAIRELDAWWASRKTKKKKPKKKPAAPKPSKVSNSRKQERENARLRREIEELRRREQERKEERKLEREQRAEEREERLRQEFILSGDYQGLAELEGISDSEAYTEILYAQMEMGAAGVAA